MKQKMIFTLTADKNLQLEIQCKHGFIQTSTFQGEEDPTAVRYMVNELIEDEKISSAFDIEFSDEYGLA